MTTIRATITAATIADAAAELRPCMNPASIIWPAWQEPGTVQSQRTTKSRRAEQAIVILNPSFLGWGADDGDE